MKKHGGFTLIELMIVVAIIAIIASVAIPNLISSRLVANEGAAIASLRQIITSQSQFQSSNSIDLNSNGAGEYGFLQELSAAQNLRGSGLRVTPAPLPPFFGVGANLGAGFATIRSGYDFKVFLPDATFAPIDEVAGAVQPPVVADAPAQETMWCAYAFPNNRRNTGNRTFFVNQQGVILQTANVTAPFYDSTAPISSANALAAYANGGPGTMADNTAMSSGGVGVDGHSWAAVGN